MLRVDTKIYKDSPPVQKSTAKLREPKQKKIYFTMLIKTPDPASPPSSIMNQSSSTVLIIKPTASPEDIQSTDRNVELLNHLFFSELSQLIVRYILWTVNVVLLQTLLDCRFPMILHSINTMKALIQRVYPI